MIFAEVQQHQSGKHSTCGGIQYSENKRQKKSIFIYGTTFRINGIYPEIFSESKFIPSLTKTKKELRQTPIECIQVKFGAISLLVRPQGHSSDLMDPYLRAS